MMSISDGTGMSGHLVIPIELVTRLKELRGHAIEFIDLPATSRVSRLESISKEHQALLLAIFHGLHQVGLAERKAQPTRFDSAEYIVRYSLMPIYALDQGTTTVERRDTTHNAIAQQV